MGISRSLLAAQFFWNLDRTKQALQEVAGHLSDSPLDSEGLVLRSELLLKLGRLDEAEDSARQAITGNRQCMQAFLLLARIARTRNQWSEAEEFARQSLAVQANWLALNELALALLGQGNLSEALDCLDESLDLCWHEWTLYLRGCVLLELDLEQAERVFQSLLEWNPHGFGLLGLASVARERGRFAQALHYAELALANDPENDALHSLYAQADIELQVSIPPVGVRGSGLVLLALFLSLWISALVQAVGPVIGTPPLWITIWCPPPGNALPIPGGDSNTFACRCDLPLAPSSRIGNHLRMVDTPEVVAQISIPSRSGLESHSPEAHGVSRPRREFYP